MSSAAVAYVPSDFAELKVRAVEVERHRHIPSRFETTRAGLEILTMVALRWDRLDEPSRDLLRYLADKLGKTEEASWLQRAAGAFHVMVYASRYGADRMYREAHELVDACTRFRCAVLDAEERNNEQLQFMIGEAINAALTSGSTVELTRGQVGDWIRSIPN